MRVASPLPLLLVPKELLPRAGKRLGQEQGASPHPHRCAHSARSCAKPTLTCLICMKPQDTRIWVFQGPPQGSSTFLLLLLVQDFTVGDPCLFKHLEAPVSRDRQSSEAG